LESVVWNAAGWRLQEGTEPRGDPAVGRTCRRGPVRPGALRRARPERPCRSRAGAWRCTPARR